MHKLKYVSPRTLDDAIGAIAEANGRARVLAGGTDLLVQMRAGVIQPSLVIDIKNIEETMEIKETADGGFQIGAAVSGARLAEHPRFGRAWPGLLEAANLIGSTQVQGRASLGGNLCNASPAADSVPAMVAAGVVANAFGPDGWRRIPVEEVPTGPGRTSLFPGEMIVSFTLPPRPQNSGDAYLRMIPRTEMDIAVVGCGVNLVIENGLCRAARIALGAVAPTVVLVDTAAKALVGTHLDAEAIEAAAHACREACRPIDDKRGTIAYRTRVAGVLLKRTLAVAAERAGRVRM